MIDFKNLFKPFSAPFLLGGLLLGIGLVAIISYVNADASNLGPDDFTEGGYTNETTPEFSFQLDYDGEEEDGSVYYRLEIATAPNAWSSGGNSRVLRYDSAPIALDDGELEADTFHFTVGQDAAGGTYESGSGRLGQGDQLREGPYWWRVQLMLTGDTPNENDWETAGDEEAPFTPAFIVDTNGPDFAEPTASPAPNGWSNENNIVVSWNPAEDLEIELDDTGTSWNWPGDAETWPGSGLAGYLYIFDHEEGTIPAVEIEEPDNDVVEIDCEDVGVDCEENGEVSWDNAPEGNDLYFHIQAFDEAGNYTTHHLGPFQIDRTDPEFDDEISVTKDNNSATITWETSEPGEEGEVEYGFSTSYGNSEESVEDPANQHTVELEDLLSCTTYFYQVNLEDEAGNTVSSSDSFTTTGCLGDYEVGDQTQDTIPAGNGGTVGSQGLGIELEVPEDFSESNVIFQIKQLEVDDDEDAPPDNFRIGNYFYDLKALVEGAEPPELEDFGDESVQITIYFEEGDLEGMAADTFQIFSWDESSNEWLPIDEDCEVNDGDGDEFWVRCETSHFSVFGLFGAEESPDAPTPTPSSQPKAGSSTKTGYATPKVPSCRDAKPSSVPDLFQIDATGTQATLYFSPVTSNVNKYAVVYGHEPGQELFGTEFAQGRSSGVLSHTIGHLNPNTDYYFRVLPINGCMPGDWSNEMKIQTGNSEAVTKFYKNFVTRIVRTLQPLDG